MDVGIVLMIYLLSLKLFNTHIRSSTLNGRLLIRPIGRRVKLASLSNESGQVIKDLEIMARAGLK